MKLKNSFWKMFQNRKRRFDEPMSTIFLFFFGKKHSRIVSLYRISI